MRLCWMVCPPSQGLVSPCRLPMSRFAFLNGVPAFRGLVSPGLPLPPIVSHFLPLFFCMCACVGWCVRLPEVLSPIVSHCLPKWGVRLPDVLFPNCLPLSPHVCLCWMVCPPSRGLVSLVSLLVYLCLRLSPIVSHCLPLSPIVSHCPEVLSFIVSHCLPRYVCLCWMVCPPSRGLVSPLSPMVSFLVSLCWMVCPPSEVLSPLSPSLSSFLSSRLSPNLSFFLFPFVVGGLILHFFQTVYC